jgi:hypothetical protein
MTLIPAYGRDYQSKKEVEEAFAANKDFLNQSWGEASRLINREQIPSGTAVNIRYAKLAKVVVIRVP